MVTTIAELKELILWAKEQKLSALKLGDVEFHFDRLALIDNPFNQPETPKSPPLDGLSEADQKQNKEDDADLFWSSRS